MKLPIILRLVCACLALAVSTDPAMAGPGDDVTKPAPSRIGNIVSITQLGDQNIAVLSQNGGSTATIVQDAPSARVELSQNGLDNVATITQAGDHAAAILAQVGASNTMTVDQTAGGAAALAQFGGGNVLTYAQGAAATPIFITQMGGATASVSNGAP